MKSKIKNNTIFLVLKVLLTAVFLLAAVVTISGCACPLFSAVERITGIQVKAGENIDESFVEGELVYTDSVALFQATGDINSIIELGSRYGVALSEKDMRVLDELPPDIKENVINQEIVATVYSTADDKTEVLDFFDSIGGKWDIHKIEDQGQAADGKQPVIVVASGENELHTLILAGTDNNTFLIFMNIDMAALMEKGK
jgi:hypothetical protein